MVVENGSKLEGLHELLAHGEHESDYFIEIVAINKAGLRTVKQHKVNINQLSAKF